MNNSHHVCEQCWVITGDSDDRLWWGHRRHISNGAPTSVAFNPYWVLNRDEEKGDVLGFLHTHPSFPAAPSDRDRRTMNAWTTCLGKDLLCLIFGVDGLKGWWYEFDADENDHPIECGVRMFGGLLVGTTELDDKLDEEHDQIAIRRNGFLLGEGEKRK